MILLLLTGCDHGFTPPLKGKIEGRIVFKGTTPPSDQIKGLYFAAAPFTPCATDEILTRFNEVAISGDMKSALPGQTQTSFEISDVNPGLYTYAGVFQQYGTNLLDIRPVAVYAENRGTFAVSSGQTASIQITVDFDQLPPFPPASCQP